MPSVTISRALALKNRVVGFLAEKETYVRMNNVQEPDHPADYDVSTVLEEAAELRGKLVVLKTAIHDASAPIRALIYALSEAKSLLTFASSVPARATTGYRWGLDITGNQVREPFNTRVVVGAVTLTNTRDETSALIDRYQNEIDNFNSQTLVEVPEFNLTWTAPEPPPAQ